MGLPWWLSGKESACQCRRWEFHLWVGKIWRRKCLPTPVFLPGESHGQRILVGYSPQGFERAGHDIATKPPPPLTNTYCFVFYTFSPLVFFFMKHFKQEIERLCCEHCRYYSLHFLYLLYYVSYSSFTVLF